MGSDPCQFVLHALGSCASRLVRTSVIHLGAANPIRVETEGLPSPPIPRPSPLTCHRQDPDQVRFEPIVQGVRKPVQTQRAAPTRTWGSELRKAPKQLHRIVEFGLECVGECWPRHPGIPVHRFKHLRVRGGLVGDLHRVRRASIMARSSARTCSYGTAWVRPASRSSMRRAISSSHALAMFTGVSSAAGSKLSINRPTSWPRSSGGNCNASASMACSGIGIVNPPTDECGKFSGSGTKVHPTAR